MKGVLLIFLFLVGVASTTLLTFWVLALFLYVFGESQYPGAIAFVPKWLFLFAPLIFFGGRKEVQDLLDHLSKFFS